MRLGVPLSLFAGLMNQPAEDFFPLDGCLAQAADDASMRRRPARRAALDPEEGIAVTIAGKTLAPAPRKEFPFQLHHLPIEDTESFD